MMTRFLWMGGLAFLLLVGGENFLSGEQEEGRGARAASQGQPKTKAKPETGKAVSEGKAKASPQTVPLTLSDSVFLGLRGNRTIRSAYIDRVSQKFDLRVAEDIFTPQFSVDGEISRQRVSRTTSTVGTLSPRMNVLIPSGASFDFAWANTADNTGRSRHRGSSLEATASQPLLRGWGSEVTMAPVRTARLGERMNLLRLKQTVSETIGQIIMAHRELVRAQEQRKLSVAALERAQELLEVNKALIAAGRMAEMEIVQTEADLENRRIMVLEADNTLETARLNLLLLLALDLKTPIVANEDITPQRKPVSVDTLLPVALANRQDYLAQTIVIEQQRLGILTARNERLWDVSVFARSRLGSERTTSGYVDNTRISDVTVGVALSAPLNDLRREQAEVNAVSSLRSAELQLENIRQGVELQVRASVTEVGIRWRQLELARRSRDLAVRAVDIEKEKLKAGRSSNFEVRSMENDLRSAENQYLDAAISYMNSLTMLDLQLGTTLDTWQIALRD